MASWAYDWPTWYSDNTSDWPIYTATYTKPRRRFRFCILREPRDLEPAEAGVR